MKYRCIRRAIGVLAATLGLAAVAGPAAAQTEYRVPSDFATIQAAIDFVSDGDTIIIDPGVYHEQITLPGKDITLRGLNSSQVRLDGSSFVGPVITVTPGPSMPFLRTLSVQNGDATFGGGLLVEPGASLFVSFLEFEMNSAAAGGAVSIGANANVTLFSVRFLDNSADADGGAVFASASEFVFLDDCIFRDNTAGQDGGAVSMFNVDDARVWFNEFSDNIAGLRGGGMVIDGNTDTNARSNEFLRNSAGTDGGGLAVVGSPVVSITNDFNGNQAVGNGGALYIDSGSLYNSRQDEIFNNTAAFGGGIAVNESRCELEEVAIEGNEGTTQGGGLYMSSRSLPAVGLLYNCRLRFNRGNSGAAALITTSFAESTTPSISALFMGCLISQNTSELALGSGGVEVREFFGAGDNTLAQFINTTVSQNTGGLNSGIRGSGGPRINMSNSIVWANSGANFSNTASQTDAQYSIFPEAASYAGAGNLNTDPGFIDGPGGDFMLRGDSPAVDAGWSFRVAFDLLDLDYDGNTSEPVSLDLARLPRFVNDPLTPDTGLGPGAVVDIGAYELQRTCTADLAPPFGVANFFDLGEFLDAFNAREPEADYAAPFGVWNFLDLGEFLTQFNGC